MPGPVYGHFTSHDGLTIAHRVSGHGRPVVLIRGFPVTSTVNYATHYAYAGGGGLGATAGPTVESALLDAGFQVVMYDLRGHGHSDKPHDPGCYSMDAHVGDVQALIGHPSLDRPALVTRPPAQMNKACRGKSSVLLRLSEPAALHVIQSRAIAGRRLR